MNLQEQSIYRIHEPEDNSLYPSQELRLELADLVDKLCRENNIKYTLLFSTLAGSIENRGFFQNIFDFQIGMFYEDMLRFKEIFFQQCEDPKYYLLDYTNFKYFERVDLIVLKKGSVSLPPERKDDELYYDFGVFITPLFYAGNTKEEYEAFVETANHFTRLVNTRDFAYDLLSTRKKIRYARYWKQRKQMVSLKKEHDFDNLLQHLTQYKNTPTKYVYIPNLKKQEGCIREKETYQDVEEVLFENHGFSAIRKRREWVNRFYNEKELEMINNRPFRVFDAYGLHLLRFVQEISTDLLREMDRICRKHGIKYYIMFGTLIGALRHKGFIPWDDDVDVVMMYDDFCKFREVVIQELDPEKYCIKLPETDKNCNITFASLMRVGAERTIEERETTDTMMGIGIDIVCMFPGNEMRILEIVQDRLCRFFKTTMWAHLGADEYKPSIKKKYYKLLQKISNFKAYDIFFKIGGLNKKSNTNKLLFPYMIGLFYPHGQGLTDKNNYGDPIDLEFEGLKLMAPQNSHEILSKTYADYMNYPIYTNRRPKHIRLSIYDFSKMKQE